MPDNSKLNSRQFLAGIIFLVVLFPYFKSFFYKLIYLDDDSLIFNRFVGGNFFENLLSAINTNYLGGHYYRPLALFTLVTDSLPGKDIYYFYHISNFIIHLFVSLLIFSILMNKSGYSNIVAFFSVVIFALSPIQINAVGWIAGRADLLAGLFSTIALNFYWSFLKTDKKLNLIFSAFFLFIAVLSKEVAILVPFLFITLFFIERKEFLLNKKTIVVFIYTFFALFIYYLLRGAFLTHVHIDKFSFEAFFDNILVLPETVAKFFIPTQVRALPRIETFTSIVGIIILIILLIIPNFIKQVNIYRYYWGFTWFILLLVPGMVNKTMEQDGFFYWDCRSYLPLVGIIFMIAEILTAAKTKINLYRYNIIVSAYSILLALITFYKLDIYKNPINYWASVSSDYPESFLPYIGLYNYLNHTKNYSEAEIKLIEAIKISPKEVSLRQTLCNFYLSLNKEEEAFSVLNNTFKDEVTYAEIMFPAYISLCIKLQKTENINELIKIYSGNKKIINALKKELDLKMDALSKIGDSVNVKFLSHKLSMINKLLQP